MTDRLASYVRTLWPLVLGHLAAILIAAVARATGVELHSAVALELVSLVASGAVYGSGRWLESRVGEHLAARAARWLGRMVLSIGLTTGAPTYPERRTSQ